MSRHRVGAWAAALAVVTALALGGCSGLPTSSQVLAGRKLDERVASQARVIVPPPAPGATMEDVALGFIRAGAALQETDNQEPVGRAYLARGAVDRWRPTSLVTVFDRDTAVVATAVSASQVKLETEAVATVDGAGRYRELAPHTRVEAVFDLVQEQGQWRVSLPESGFGIWVDTDDFSLLFEAYAVHYPATGGIRRLVPDVRWFTTGPRLVTALARAQLGAVPDYLAGAAETGVPEGTRLAVDAVAVQNGTASVVLSGSANTSDVTRRRGMWAQLAATLTQVPGVTGVSLEVQGIGRIPVAGGADVVSSAAEVGFVVDAPVAARVGLVRTADRLARVDLARLDSGEVEPNWTGGPGTRSDLPTVPSSFTGLAMSPDGTDVAAVDGDGSTLGRWHGSTEVQVESLGSGLTRPAYDGQGRLWVGGVGADGAARLWWLEASGSGSSPVHTVDVPWLQRRVLLALAVSRDLTRMAVISRAASGGDTRLDISGIVRDGAGVPTALAPGHRQGEPLTRLVDATWTDERTVAVLGALQETDPVRVFAVELGQGVGLRRVGLSDPAVGLGSPVAGAKALLAAGGTRGFAVMTSAPSVVLRAGATWQRLGAATELAVPPATT